MSDTIYVGQRVSNIEVSPQFQPYSRVIIHIDNDTQVVAGNDTGRTLEIDNPFGNQQMANSILQSLSGFQYQPYNADEVLLDPAAEIGDAIESYSVHGGIYSRNRSFDRLMKADVAAPTDEEINHEYVFETPTERAYKRQVEDVKASFVLTNDKILTEVERASAAEGTLKSTIEQTATEINATVAEESAKKLDHTNTSQSFGWSLTASAFLLKNNNTTVFQFDANGLRFKSNGADVFTVTRTGGLYVKGNGEFTGKVTAASGKIGGFDIGATALSYNGLTWGDTSKNYGVYIGQSGIQLGKNFSVNNSGGVTAKNLAIQGGSISIGENFNVTQSGAITASRLTLKGGITFLNDDGSYAGSMSAANLRQGAAEGYSWGSGGGGYGGYSSRAAYALAGGSAGFSAESSWNDFINGRTVLGNLTVSGVMRINNQLNLWNMGAGYATQTVVTGVGYRIGYIDGRQVITSITPQTTTIAYLEIR